MKYYILLSIEIIVQIFKNMFWIMNITLLHKFSMSLEAVSIKKLNKAIEIKSIEKAYMR